MCCPGFPRLWRATTGRQSTGTPEFIYIVKPLGAFMLVLGVMGAAAARDPTGVIVRLSTGLSCCSRSADSSGSFFQEENRRRARDLRWSEHRQYDLFSWLLLQHYFFLFFAQQPKRQVVRPDCGQTDVSRFFCSLVRSHWWRWISWKGHRGQDVAPPVQAALGPGSVMFPGRHNRRLWRSAVWRLGDGTER